MTTTVPLQQTAYVASNQPHHFNALSISFRESATVPGIPLSYASNPHLLQQRLEDWDQEFPADNKAKVSIRLQVRQRGCSFFRGCVLILALLISHWDTGRSHDRCTLDTL